MGDICPLLSAVKLAVSNPGDPHDATWHVPCLKEKCVFWVEVVIHLGERRQQGCGLVLKTDKRV
ncbi:MAG TPA: hypothetical protein VMW91_04790 [Desulfosporosinus sp.]|nr:hypothetical protein [Desulfosporosinus sp.]